jgi:hypothetical protein
MIPVLKRLGEAVNLAKFEQVRQRLKRMWRDHHYVVCVPRYVMEVMMATLKNNSPLTSINLVACVNCFSPEQC